MLPLFRADEVFFKQGYMPVSLKWAIHIKPSSLGPSQQQRARLTIYRECCGRWDGGRHIRVRSGHGHY